MVSMITRIKYKERAGEPLTEEERAYRREYKKKYTKAQMCIYVRPETQEAWLELAAARGMALSQWIVERVLASLAPDPQTGVLRTEIQAQRDEIASLKRFASEALARTAETEGKLRSIESDLVEALREQVRQMKEGSR